MCPKSLLIVISLSICFSLICCSDNDNSDTYRVSPKLMARFRISHTDDPTLNKLDESLAKVSTIYMQALFSGTHSPELEKNMRKLEIDLFDQLDSLFEQQRLQDYMKYEAEVTRQMIIYNMLKKLFGYDVEESEKVNWSGKTIEQRWFQQICL